MLKRILILALTTSVLAYNSSHFIQSDSYYFSTIQTSFYQAYAICKNNGWTLVAPRSSLDENRLNTFLVRNGITYSFWIGGFYLRNQLFNPRFIWLDNGTHLNYTNWATNQPLISSSDEYCVAKSGIGAGFDYPGRWLSNLCNNSVSFVCQDV